MVCGHRNFVDAKFSFNFVLAAYSAAISALSKGQMWHKALELFREIEATGGKPSIVTYNATMTALEKGLQWERALDLFDEMKSKSMPVTVVSYGSAISACEKGLQYRQCLEYLDEMTEMGIKKNVIIFGAAMSCMEKSCRADIAFQLMERMKFEGVAPNVHIYNSAISACARCSLWEKGYQLFQEMEQVGVPRDVVTYNAVLDAVCSQVQLGRRLFKEGMLCCIMMKYFCVVSKLTCRFALGVEKGFYARVSRLGTQWLELDLHFLSLGGGEIALGWWFEECLVPYLVNTSKLEAVQSISIVTGYGKTRSRGARLNDDGMRLRVRAMLKYMGIKEMTQPNKGRIHINKAELIEEVKKNGGRIKFDVTGYTTFKEEETTANKFPDVAQSVRPRFRPARPGEGPPGTFVRDGDGEPLPSNLKVEEAEPRHEPASRQADSYQQERRENRHSPYAGDDRGPRSSWQQERRSSYGERKTVDRGFDDHGGRDRRGQYDENTRRGNPYGREREAGAGGYDDYHELRGSFSGPVDTRHSYGDPDRKSRQLDVNERRGMYREWERRGSFERERMPNHYERDRHDDRGEDTSRRRPPHRDSYYVEERRPFQDGDYGRGPTRDFEMSDRRPSGRDIGMADRGFDVGPMNNPSFPEARSGQPSERAAKRQRHSLQQFGEPAGNHEPRQKRASDSVLYVNNRGVGLSSGIIKQFGTIDEDPDPFREEPEDPLQQQPKKRSYDDDLKPAANRGYNIEPSYTKRRSP